MPDGTGGVPGAGGDPGAGGMPSGEGGMGGEPPVVGPINLFGQSDFEAGTLANWKPHSATVTSSTAFARSGTHSLFVTDRTSDWRGVEFDILGFEPGSYTVSVWVATAAGSGPQTLRLSTQIKGTGCNPDVANPNGDVFSWVHNTSNNAEATWVNLTNANFTIAAPAQGCTRSYYAIFVEGAAADVSFYLDDVTIYKNP
jgi:hypothetical protein